jgi:hypothetical protein
MDIIFIISAVLVDKADSFDFMIIDILEDFTDLNFLSFKKLQDLAVH